MGSQIHLNTYIYIRNGFDLISRSALIIIIKKGSILNLFTMFLFYSGLSMQASVTSVLGKLKHFPSILNYFTHHQVLNLKEMTAQGFLFRMQYFSKMRYMRLSSIWLCDCDFEIWHSFHWFVWFLYFVPVDVKFKFKRKICSSPQIRCLEWYAT